MNNKRSFILEKAKTLFFKVGIHSVSMDDLAKACGISKKSIYCCFENKSEIISSIAFNELENNSSAIKNIISNSAKPNLALLSFFKILDVKFSNYDFLLLYDLQKYHNEIYDLVMKHSRQMIIDFLENNIKNGIVEGCYRKVPDIDRLIMMYVKLIELFLQDKSEHRKNGQEMEFIGQHLIDYLVAK